MKRCESCLRELNDSEVLQCQYEINRSSEWFDVCPYCGSKKVEEIKNE